MIKKIIFVLACLFIFALNYNNESLAYTEEDQNIEISFVVPPSMFNNMLYSSVDDNSIYWVIDYDTFILHDWLIYNRQTGSYMQNIDIDSIDIDTFYNFLDTSNKYIIFNIRAYQAAYMMTIPEVWQLCIDDISSGMIPYNINGTFISSYIHTNYKNKNYIETLINNLQLLNLTLQLNNEIYFENGFDSGSAFGYDDGYDAGYTQGVLDGTSDGQLEIWTDGHEKGVADGITIGQAQGFDTGFVEGVSAAYEGGFEGFSYSELSLLTDETSYTYYAGIYASDSAKYDAAYEAGRNYERANPVIFAWITGLFSAMGAFLGIAILPNITIGLIVSIPLLFGLVMFFIKLFRGS